MEETPYKFQQRHCLRIKCLIYGAYTNFVMVGGLVCCICWLSCWSVQVVSWFHTGSMPGGVRALLGLDRAWPHAILSEVVQVEKNLLIVFWFLPIWGWCNLIWEALKACYIFLWNKDWRRFVAGPSAICGIWCAARGECLVCLTPSPNIMF